VTVIAGVLRPPQKHHTGVFHYLLDTGIVQIHLDIGNVVEPHEHVEARVAPGVLIVEETREFLRDVRRPRLGRLLIAMLLHQGGLLAQPLLYLSLYFKQHRPVYYELLDRVRTQGDWEAWVDFFLEGVEQTAQGAVQTAQRLVALFQQDSQRIQASGRGAANALRVLHALRSHPVATLKLLRTETGMSFPTVGKVMQTLMELGIARELTGQRRNRVFVYDGYLSILNEGGEAL